MKTLLKNAGILAWENESFKYIPNGFLTVDGDTISGIYTEMPQGDFERALDMSGRLLMPGLINCHTHAAMTLLRGIGSDLPLQKWLEDAMWPVEDRLTPEQIKAGNELAMLEFIAGGVTSVTDMYMQPRTFVELNERVGMKLNLTRVVQAFNPDERFEDSTMGREAFAFFEEYNGLQNGRIKVDFSIHAEYTITEKVTRGFSEKLRAHIGTGTVMHLHLSETQKEHDECIARHGLTPAAWFNKLGIFDMPTAAAHCVAVTEDDLAILREKGVSPVHNPTSNLKLGSGFAPIPRMLELGLNVALGTDGAASNNNLNMFEEMHLAAIIHNGFMRNPEIMKPAEVLKMATINGARLQGRTDTGCIAVGKKADIIAIDLRRPHMYPNFDPLPLLVYSAQASDVCMTMVDGQLLYLNGEFLTIDKERALANAAQAVRELYGEEI